MCLSIEYSTKLCENAILEFSLSIQSWPYVNMDLMVELVAMHCFWKIVSRFHIHTQQYYIEATYGPFGSVTNIFHDKEARKIR